MAVFQGHSHNNEYKEIAGVHYCTLQAMVEGAGPNDNGFSLIEVHPDGTIRVEGFKKQTDYDWKGNGA